MAAGIGILALAINDINLELVLTQVKQIGWNGLLVVLGIYCLAFILDSITWTMAITSLPVNVIWVLRTLIIRLVGEAFNNTIPAGGVGGEPVKAILLNTHYGIEFGQGAASLVLAKTINMISLCIFLVFGFIIMFLSNKLSLEAKQISFIGLMVVLISTGLLFLVQKIEFWSLSSNYLFKFKVFHSLDNIINYLKVFDGVIKAFYHNFLLRFGGAIFLALWNWLLGVLEVFYAMHFLGFPITLSEAYIIEAVTQMVRMGTFFIPMSLGAQEGTFVIVVQIITGSGVAGLALGIIRRIRELIWILLGFVFGLCFWFVKKNR